MEFDSDGSDSTHAALQTDIDQARAEFRKIQNCTDLAKAHIPNYEGKVAAAKSTFDAAMAAKRTAHPLKKQVEAADSHQGKLTKKVAEAKLAVDARSEESQKAQTALQTQEATLAELQEALAKADKEIAELATRLDSEHAAAAPSAPVVGHARPASGDTAPERFISNAEASARWSEFMAKFELVTSYRLCLVVVVTVQSCAQAAPTTTSVGQLMLKQHVQSGKQHSKYTGSCAS